MIHLNIIQWKFTKKWFFLKLIDKKNLFKINMLKF